MRNQEIKKFVEALQEVQHSSQEASLELMVKYTCDPRFIAPQWPMPKGDYITETGLLDPGFGQGPTDFSDIEVIRVHTTQIYHQMSEIGYMNMVNRLMEMVSGIEGVKISKEYIEFTNSST